MNKFFMIFGALIPIMTLVGVGTYVSLSNDLFTDAQQSSMQNQQVIDKEDVLSEGTITLPNGQDVELEGQINKMVVQTFNSQFEAYKGSGKSASQIRSLESVVKTSNLNHTENQVYTYVPEVINNTTKYTVEFEYDYEGYIYYVLVTEENEINVNSTKMDLNINDDSYFDDLRLHVGDVFNVYNGNNRIVAFCSVLEGEKPQIGEKFRIESKISPEYTYEVILYNIEESLNSDGSELLYLYFYGVTADEAKFTPQIKRLK